MSLGTLARDLTWADVRSRVHGQREAVYKGWLMHGPCTTRELAQRLGMEILSVRPRTTELCELGLVQAVDLRGHEGVYAAIDFETARQSFERTHAAPIPAVQRELSFNDGHGA